MDAIVVEELRKCYGKVQALDGVNFTVQEGEVFGLLGPNGAGKTTTVKVLATLTKPDSGRAEVVFQDVVKEPNAVRRTIGYVPQSSGVDREATGRENLMLQGRVQGMSGRKLRARVDELLELVVSGARAIPQILFALERSGITVEAVDTHRPSLDDVYLHFTGRQFRAEDEAAAE